ncbi:MAG: hypothetical protein V7K67_15600 [Nostoc sp.]|uniref:hypothetical protein n=1 Tax=Nostoc sp. TaxID=1180 RepID=UPI002FEF43D0
MTQLDFTELYEVFAKLPKVQLYLLAETLEPNTNLQNDWDFEVLINFFSVERYA